jgi:hypothetical protein
MAISHVPPRQLGGRRPVKAHAGEKSVGTDKPPNSREPFGPAPDGYGQKRSNADTTALMHDLKRSRRLI